MPIGKGALQSVALGQCGSSYFADIVAHTGEWGVITCITNCTFTTLTSGLRVDGVTAVMKGTLNGMVLVAGQQLFGYFTAITLASGSVVAYEV